MPLYIVETVQLFRHRYIIECNDLEHAYDTVTCKEATEFSQMDLDETIVSGREITYEEFNKMNESLKNLGDGTTYQPEIGSPWLGDKVIHKVVY